MGHRMGVLEVSLPKYVNSLYQMSEIGQVIAASFWVTFFVCRKPCHPKLFFFLYQLKSLLFSSQAGAKCKIFKLIMFNGHL